MSSTFEDSVLDFDFNFLQQIPKNNVVENKVEKQRKAILIAKRKTIATDSLIKKYYAKKEKLDQAEKYLIASKEECKQICINYNTAFERCTKLEKEAQLLYQKSQELQERLNFSENQCQAIQSHANQLQVLVREHETQIESLKIENQLEKSHTKEQTKSVMLNKNEGEDLVKHICLLRDIVLGKKKLRKRHKIILQKYEKYKPTKANEFATDSSDDEMDIFKHSAKTSLYRDISNNNINEALTTCTIKKLKKTLKSDNQITQSIDGDNDSDSGNEFISEDTGRGSSPACSDIDKCFNSPDYQISHSPFSNTINKEKNYTDIATSPITVHKVQNDIATSPIAFSDKIANIDALKIDASTSPITVNIEHVGVATSPIAFSDKIFSNSEFKKNLATSPIIVQLEITEENQTNFVLNNQKASSPGAIHKVHVEEGCGFRRIIENKDIGITVDPRDFVLYTDIATSPIGNAEQKAATSPDNYDELRGITSFMSTCNKTMERECLEINNSNILNKNHSYDCEVDSILSTMRFDRELITPIPKTPARNAETVQATCGDVCQEAAKVREENKILKESIADLAKEIFNIKSLLNNRISVNESVNQSYSQDDIDIVNDTLIDTDPLRKSQNVDNVTENTSEIINSINRNYHQHSPEPEKTLENDLMENNIEIIDHSENEVDAIPNKDCVFKAPISVIEKVKRIKKLTRLEKLRKKLLPKSKIRRAKSPPIRKVKRKKQLLFKGKLLEPPSTAALNNKSAYEKAVKFMTELKSKENNNINNSSPRNSLHKSNNILEMSTLLSECNGSKEVNSKNSSTLVDNVTSLTDIRDGNRATSALEENSQSISRNTPKSHVDNIISACEMKSDTSLTSSITPCDVNTTVNKENSQALLASSNLSVTTRSRSKRLSSVLSENLENDNTFDISQTNSGTAKVTEGRKKIKRVAVDKSEFISTRMLRSSNAFNFSNLNNLSESTNDNENSDTSKNKDSTIIYNSKYNLSSSKKDEENIPKLIEDPKLSEAVTYSDLDVFTETLSPSKNHRNKTNASDKIHPKESILCRMLDKYAKNTVRSSVKKIQECSINSTCKKLAESIAHIISVPQHETKHAMNNFVKEIQTWNMRVFLAGLMKYLKDPGRRDELFNKVITPPAPQMTKQEQVLIYVLKQLQHFWPSVDFVKIVLANIEFALFQLNHTPEFGTVESMAHFYAVVCRYFRAKSRLRLFILDAMYCIQYKSVALIKQCLEVWMHILPLAHMGIAKSPLVTCLVYLLHFFKCEDKSNRVQEIRSILSRKYFYQVTEWTETKILEMFKTAIKELRDIPIEKKMLRMSLIILAKRRGPQWCQKNIIKNMLQSLIEKEDVSDKVKEFCISLLGPILKPYPNDMKVHCEIVVNQLLEMLDRDVSHSMKEAIISSLLFMRRHNQDRVMEALLSWNPKQVSPELDQLLKDYVKEKPAKVWRTILSRIPVM